MKNLKLKLLHQLGSLFSTSLDSRVLLNGIKPPPILFSAKGSQIRRIVFYRVTLSYERSFCVQKLGNREQSPWLNALVIATKQSSRTSSPFVFRSKWRHVFFSKSPVFVGETRKWVLRIYDDFCALRAVGLAVFRICIRIWGGQVEMRM